MADTPETLRDRRVASLSRPVDALVRDRKPLNPLQKLYLRMEMALWERRYEVPGVETRAMSIQLDHFHPDHTHYEPSFLRYLPKVLKAGDVTPDDVFLDIGCGKGRIVLQAARHYPFARVLGLEISEELAAMARANLDAARPALRARDVEIVVANAATWPIPDDVSWIYLFHPVAGRTFDEMMARVVESLDRRERRLRIIYAAPLDAERVLATGRFRVIRDVTLRPVPRKVRQIQVFESLPR